MKKLGLLGLSLVTLLGLLGCSKNQDKVVVLTSSGYEPYEMIDLNGKLTGFDIELMEAIADEAGFEIEWQDVSFDGIIATLQSGQAEIAIAGITPTTEREDAVDFSQVYYNSESGLENYFIYSDSTVITDLNSLEGLVVGAQLGTVQAELIEELKTIYNFSTDLRNTNTQIVEEINAGRIDVLIVESLVADSILEVNEELSKLKVEYTTDTLYGNAIAFMKDSEYKELVDTALITLQENGTIDQLITKWFTE